jgi:lipopolysaccharide biosynthesis glycosyltransferase
MRASRYAVVVISDGQLLPAAKCLCDRLARMNPRADTDIVLFSDVLSLRQHRFTVLSSATLGLPKVSFETRSYVTAATYHRLFVPTALAETYERILYLDVDVLPFSAAIFDLFDAPMRGAPIAACRDHTTFSPSWNRTGKTFDGEFEYDRYFNAGVLLIDVTAFIEAKLGEQAHALIANRPPGNPLPHLDQTALNLAAAGQWVEMSPAMNMWPGLLPTIVAERYPPKILHYYGHRKPWNTPTHAYNHPTRRALMVDLLRAGEWRFLLRHTNLRAMTRHRAKLLLRTAFRDRFADHLLEIDLPYISENNGDLVEYLTSTPFIDREMVGTAS